MRQSQLVFPPAWSCIDPIFTLPQALKHNQILRRFTISMALCLKSAFNSADCAVMCKRLHQGNSFHSSNICVQTPEADFVLVVIFHPSSPHEMMFPRVYSSIFVICTLNRAIPMQAMNMPTDRR